MGTQDGRAEEGTQDQPVAESLPVVLRQKKAGLLQPTTERQLRDIQRLKLNQREDERSDQVQDQIAEALRLSSESTGRVLR